MSDHPSDDLIAGAERVLALLNAEAELESARRARAEGEIEQLSVEREALRREIAAIEAERDSLRERYLSAQAALAFGGTGSGEA